MENRRLFFLLASIVLATISIVSCDKDSMIEPNESFYADPNAVSSKEAVNVAEAYILSDKKITTRADGLKVKSYSSIKDEVGSDIIHVFNYEGGGFALISGDNRLEPVLAYSESASFGNDVNAFPVGLRIWVEGIKSKLDKIKSDDLPQEASIKCLWDKYNGVVMTRSLDPWSGIDPECDTIVGPLLTNTWHQYASYNDYLIDAYHFNTFTNMYDTLHKPVVGCVPLSIARVLHFWGYPTSYPWSSMSSTSENHYNKTFLSDVHYDVKNYAESHSYYFGYCYYPSVSAPRNYATSVSTTFPIGTFICYRYGYASATTIDYSTSQNYTIRRELFDYGRPVIIGGTNSGGSGHAWVCDGYRYKYEHFYDSDMNPIGVATNLLYHRWGEPNSQFDGWYIPSNVDPENSGYGYNTNMTLTYQIQPY